MSKNLFIDICDSFQALLTAALAFQQLQRYCNQEGAEGVGHKINVEADQNLYPESQKSPPSLHAQNQKTDQAATSTLKRRREPNPLEDVKIFRNKYFHEPNNSEGIPDDDFILDISMNPSDTAEKLIEAGLSDSYLAKLDSIKSEVLKIKNHELSSQAKAELAYLMTFRNPYHFHEAVKDLKTYDTDILNLMILHLKTEAKKDSTAQFILGYCFHKGIGVLQDKEEAAKYFKMSADQENPDGQNYYGKYLQHGTGGVKQDEAAAVKMYRESANEGNPYAQYNLAYCYENEIGVAKDLEEAIKLYKPIANQGHSDAQCNLGLIYLHSDPNYAVYWFDLSAFRENKNGQYCLGYCLYYGIGGHQDKNTGITMMRNAAKAGCQKAVDALAEICRSLENKLREITVVPTHRRMVWENNR